MKVVVKDLWGVDFGNGGGDDGDGGDGGGGDFDCWCSGEEPT